MTEQQIFNFSITEVSDQDIEKLQKIYTVKEVEIVLQFIKKYPFIIQILLNAPKEINKYFPGDRLGLEVHLDPGTTENDEELFIIIFTTIECYEAIDRLWQLDEDWLLPISRDAQHKLEIHLG